MGQETETRWHYSRQDKICVKKFALATKHERKKNEEITLAKWKKESVLKCLHQLLNMREVRTRKQEEGICEMNETVLKRRGGCYNVMAEGMTKKGQSKEFV